MVLSAMFFSLISREISNAFYCRSIGRTENRIYSNCQLLALKEHFSIFDQTRTDQLQLGLANQPPFSADTRYRSARAADATYRHANRYSV